MNYSIDDERRTIFKRIEVFCKNNLESLFGPLILLIALILRIKTGYKKGEKLKLMRDHGRFKKGTMLEFVKLYSNNNPFEQSLIIVKINKIVITLPEYMVKETSYLKRFLTGYEFNAKMIKGTRRLGKSHPFLIMKILYNVIYLPVDMFLWVKNHLQKRTNE